jgi:hypothetical protein
MIANTSELHLVTGDHNCRDTEKTLDTLVRVVTQLMGARYEARPLSEVVTQMARNKISLVRNV